MSMGLGRRSLAAVLAAALAASAGQAVGQQQSAEINGITFVVAGGRTTALSPTSTGGLVSLDGFEVTAEPGQVVVDGQVYPVSGPREVVVRSTAGAIRVVVDGAVIHEASRTDELQRRAAEGDVDAMARLAMAYFNGDGIDRNDAEGASLLRRAAEAGNAEAQSVFAYRLFDGVGVEQDVEAARFWAERASAAGHEPAFALYGEMLLFGIGGPADGPGALAVLEAGHAAGDADATLLLGLAYGTGDATEADPVRAAEYYRAAAAAGLIQGTRNLAVLAAEGDFAVVPAEEARASVAELAAAGHPDAERVAAFVEERVAALGVGQPASLEEPRYYYADGMTAVGPLSLSAFRAARDEGLIQPDTWVWEPGPDGWIAARDMPALGQ